MSCPVLCWVGTFIKGWAMADDMHNFRVKFKDGSEEFMGWSRHELRGDGMAGHFARQQEKKIAKQENREPRKIVNVDRYYG